MGLAAVPFGTAQAEDYKLQAHAGDGSLYVSACFCESIEPLENCPRELQFCGNFGGEYEKLFAGGFPKLYDGQWRVLRGYHDTRGGKVVVTDTKFSEGKSVTCKDVEEQWQRENALIRDWWKARTWGKTFMVDCKMYDLPKDCEVLHCTLLRGRVLNLLLVRDKQRSFGGSEYMLIIVVPDDCETMQVTSDIPTIVCGGEVKEFISDNEILDPSVRSRLLSALGQKELSVKSWAAVSDPQSKTDAPKVFLKDCPFVQQSALVAQAYPVSQKGSFLFKIWERFPGGFRLHFMDREVCGKVDRQYFLSDMKYSFEEYVQKREKFSELLHRGAKHNAVHHLKALAKDNAVRCIEDLKEKLKKLEEKLEEVSKKEGLKK